MAELALGTIPLAALAVTGFKSVWPRMKTYRNADRMVRRWNRELRGHARTFKEACRFVLGYIVSTQTMISEMLANPLHSKWDDPELGRRLAELLGPERFGDWVETVSDIKEVSREPNDILERFPAVLAGVEQEMDVLDELGKLNRQLGKLQKDVTPSRGKTPQVPRRGMPSITRKSLHVETEVRKKHQPPAMPQVTGRYLADVSMLTPEKPNLSSSWFSLETAGRNDQLWSLGMALLQTDAWSRIARDDERRLMHLLKCRTSIGTRFREITEQCLTGRFRCGSTDLNNPHLESRLVEFVEEMGTMGKTLERMGL